MHVKCDGCPVVGPCIAQRPGHEWACRTATEPDGPAWLVKASEHASGQPMPTPSYPSLSTQAANLATAAVQIAASGGVKVSRKEYDRRRAICQACPTNAYDAEQDACRRCGCWLKYKPRFKAMSCPDGHW